MVCCQQDYKVHLGFDIPLMFQGLGIKDVGLKGCKVGFGIHLVLSRHKVVGFD